MASYIYHAHACSAYMHAERIPRAYDYIFEKLFYSAHKLTRNGYFGKKWKLIPHDYRGTARGTKIVPVVYYYGQNLVLYAILSRGEMQF